MKKLSAAAGFDPGILPGPMYEYLAALLQTLFTDPALAKLLSRPHCLGNLLLAAAIWQDAPGLRLPIEDQKKLSPKVRPDTHTSVQAALKGQDLLQH